MAHPRLEVMHSTAQRVRLRYPDTCADDDLETLIHAFLMFFLSLVDSCMED